MVMREDILPGAVLTRVASSHIRVGTFQYFAARRDVASLRQLGDHVIARHYPDAASAPNPYRALLENVMARQADLVARWLMVGFIHGVMNTDNMSVAGETIDYGPCAFMDAYDPGTVFSSIDQFGRYAYANQPSIAAWNLARLAECLLPLLSADEDDAVAQAQEALGEFTGLFNAAYVGGLRRKLGLAKVEDGDLALAQQLLGIMTEAKADFTLTFRRLSDAAADPGADAQVAALFGDHAGFFGDWAVRWRQRLSSETRTPEERSAAMKSANPLFIPRNHRVEAVISAAIDRQDYGPFEELLRVLSTPFEDRPEFAAYAEPPPDEQRVYRTYCGT